MIKALISISVFFWIFAVSPCLTISLSEWEVAFFPASAIVTGIGSNAVSTCNKTNTALHCSADCKDICFCPGGDCTSIRECPDNSLCNHNASTPFCDQAVTKCGTASDPPPICLSAGALPSLQDCSKYYICASPNDPNPYEVDCKALQFDPCTLKCAENVTCAAPVDCDKPGKNGPMDGCNAFCYTCIDVEVAIIDKCPANSSSIAFISDDVPLATVQDEAICWQADKIPSATSCHKYYNCDEIGDESPFGIDCGDEIFDVEFLQCSANATCYEEPTCSSPGDGGFYDLDTQIFCYFCLSEQSLFIYRCNTTLPYHLAEQSAQTCSSVGQRFPVSGNCHQYLLCTSVGGPTITRTCPNGTFYDNVKQSCVLGTCPVPPPDPTTNCEKVGNRFPDPTNCTNYFLCVKLNEPPILRKCPVGTYYDPNRLSCILGTCVNPPTTTTEEPTTPTTTEEPTTSTTTEEPSTPTTTEEPSTPTTTEEPSTPTTTEEPSTPTTTEEPSTPTTTEEPSTPTTTEEPSTPTTDESTTPATQTTLKCKRGERMPDQEDCTKYYICTQTEDNGLDFTSRDCPPGTYFDETECKLGTCPTSID